MRRTIAGAVATAAVVAAGVLSTGTAQAAPTISGQCAGDITSGIASTWPWAHDGQVEFPPPPGSIALWVEIFGPDNGVSSVRELQALFCS